MTPTIPDLYQSAWNRHMVLARDGTVLVFDRFDFSGDVVSGRPETRSISYRRDFRSLDHIKCDLTEDLDIVEVLPLTYEEMRLLNSDSPAT